MIVLDYKNGKPLHEQIETKMRSLIICGALKADEKLPSVRELSVELTVNPNTVQRAYKELESEGVIYSIRGKGNFVSGTKERGEGHIEKLYDELLNAAGELCYLGEPAERLQHMIENIYLERRD